jgi:N-acetylmuramate 1-kinase
MIGHTMKLQEDLVAFGMEALGISGSVPMDLIPLEGRGSDRRYFRLKWHCDHSVILVQYNPERAENTYYADIAEFLLSIHVPVPRLIRHDPSNCLILMEDLGGSDLWLLRKCHWALRGSLYRQTLEVVQRLHSYPQKDFQSRNIRLMESFGPELYRWERDYFRENFIGVLQGIELEQSFLWELDEELSGLADRLAQGPCCLVHRDLQSQNVMIQHGQVFLIDFQGMRFGNPFYDLGSLLFDPYVCFTPGEREDLLGYYYRLLPWELDWKAFQDAFWEASVQRLMQALGAYGFLGIKRGLKSYLSHVPAGLHHLKSAAEHTAKLPRLRELLNRC